MHIFAPQPSNRVCFSQHMTILLSHSLYACWRQGAPSTLTSQMSLGPPSGPHNTSLLPFSPRHHPLQVQGFGSTPTFMGLASSKGCGPSLLESSIALYNSGSWTTSLLGGGSHWYSGSLRTNGTFDSRFLRLLYPPPALRPAAY